MLAYAIVIAFLLTVLFVIGLVIYKFIAPHLMRDREGHYEVQRNTFEYGTGTQLIGTAPPGSLMDSIVQYDEKRN